MDRQRNQESRGVSQSGKARCKFRGEERVVFSIVNYKIIEQIKGLLLVVID
jgi:hypothetical protein